MLAGRVASIQVNLGEGYIFTVMAAAVIGGINLQGGRGEMLGALGGVLLAQLVASALIVFLPAAGSAGGRGFLSLLLA